MAIQGILKGFGDPNDRGNFIALVGRGAHYQLLDASRCLGTSEELDQGLKNFSALAHHRCESGWLSVTGLETNLSGTTVSSYGRDSFADSQQ